MCKKKKKKLCETEAPKVQRAPRLTLNVTKFREIFAEERETFFSQRTRPLGGNLVI